MTKPVLNIAVLGFALVFSCSASAYYPPEAGKSFAYLPLKGIDTVAVNIDGSYQSYERYGLIPQRLKTLITQRLEAAGLRVVDADQVPQIPSAALLNLQIRINETAYYYYAYGLNLALRQKVPLLSGSFTTVSTWSDGQVGAMTPIQLVNINDYSLHLVDNFIRAHREQN
jgi:hypothetical protein